MTPRERQRLEARHWSHLDSSRFVSCSGLRWHLQEMGEGPLVLLVHGTGASTHSWAALAPLLARHFRVLAVDLPGHGFTDLAPAEGMSLFGMAGLLADLLDELGAAPALVAGHSAGAAILARMCLDGRIKPAAIISINGAMLPLPGVTGKLYPGAARLLAALPAVPTLVSSLGSQRAVIKQLIRGTGSELDRSGLDYYRTLVGSSAHVNGAIQMMANWNLDSLERELPGLEPPLYLLACKNDKAVPFAQAARLKVQLPSAHLRVLPGLGHLGHEESPELFADLFGEIARENGIPV